MSIKFIDENLIGQSGLSRYLDPNSGWLRDIQDYDIAIYTDTCCFTSNIDPNKINYAWLIEPPIINGDNYLNIIKPQYSRLFHTVFSYNKWVGDRISNFKFVPHGGSWLRLEDISIHNKDILCSMIFSNKQWTLGHMQRTRVFDKIRHSGLVDFFGSGVNKYIEYKITGLKQYMFSIAMENEGPQHLFSPNTDYFSEKLLDCFLTGTIPIYYGNKSIEQYFDMDGILLFEDPDQIEDIINSINSKLYISKLKSIQKNFHIAKRYIHPENIINEYI